MTYNNIIELFRAFADSHFMVRKFVENQVSDITNEEVNEYPLMAVFFDSSNYQEKTEIYNLSVYILDLPHTKEGEVRNEQEVISDTKQIAEDILADIRNGHQIFRFDDLVDVRNSTILPLIDTQSQMLTGVSFQLAIEIPFTANACDAPLTGVVPTPAGDCENATYQNSDQSFSQEIAAGQTFTSNDITVTDVDGETRQVPSNIAVLCAWTLIRLRNKNGLDMASIASFPAGGIYIIPNSDINLRNNNNTLLQVVDHAPYEDITVNDVQVQDINSVMQSTEIAMFINLPNVEVTGVSTSGGVMTILTPSCPPVPTPSGICYNDHHPVFDNSYVSNDSFALFKLGAYDRTPPTYPVSKAQLDFDAVQSDIRATPATGTSATDNVGYTMLKENNAFGNKYRFTDDAGNPSDATVGSNLWAHVDWNNHSWTGATPYYVIDHLDGWGKTVKYANDAGKVNMDVGANDWATWLTWIAGATWEGVYSGFIPLDMGDMNGPHGAKANPTAEWADNFFEFDASVSGSSRGSFLTGESYDSNNFYPIYDTGNADMSIEQTKATSSGFQHRLINVFMKRKHYS